jgi:hypothetical protein
MTTQSKESLPLSKTDNDKLLQRIFQKQLHFMIGVTYFPEEDLQALIHSKETELFLIISEQENSTNSYGVKLDYISIDQTAGSLEENHTINIEGKIDSTDGGDQVASIRFSVNKFNIFSGYVRATALVVSTTFPEIPFSFQPKKEKSK